MSRPLMKTLLPLALLCLLLLVAVAGSGAAPASLLQRNLRALQVLEKGARVPVAWTELEWWSPLCRAAEAPEAAGAPPDAGQCAPTDSACRRFQALDEVFEGRCTSATDLLATLQGGERRVTDDNLSAYIHSMLGEWAAAADKGPGAGLRDTPYPLRKYWANVYYRAATEPGTAPERAAEWYRLAEQLAGASAIDADLDLYSFFSARQLPLPAWQELRLALSYMDSASLGKWGDAYGAAMESAGQTYNLSIEEGSDPDAGVLLPSPPTPQFPLAYRWDDNWELIGYTVDRMDLEAHPLLPLYLYWRYSEGEEVRGYVAQLATLRNLAPDAGFSWTGPSTGNRPPGYIGIYGARSPYPVTIESQDGGQYLCIENPQVGSNGLQGPLVNLEPGAARLLAAATFRTEGEGRAFFGVRWRYQETEAVDMRHVVRDGTSQEWERVSEVVEIAAAATAPQVAVYLSQFQSQGATCFDDLLVLELPSPPVLQVGSHPESNE